MQQRWSFLMTRLPSIVASLAVLATLAGAPVALAQVKGNFDDADTNHDGRVTLQEYQTYVTHRLMASNGPRAQKFKELTPDQQAQRLQQRFDELDAGRKGYLDRKDWSGS
jgi:Ca2+-binding EF-hand superfamily protein